MTYSKAQHDRLAGLSIAVLFSTMLLSCSCNKSTADRIVDWRIEYSINGETHKALEYHSSGLLSHGPKTSCCALLDDTQSKAKFILRLTDGHGIDTQFYLESIVSSETPCFVYRKRYHNIDDRFEIRIPISEGGYCGNIILKEKSWFEFIKSEDPDVSLRILFQIAFIQAINYGELHQGDTVLLDNGVIKLYSDQVRNRKEYKTYPFKWDDSIFSEQ